MLKSALRKQEMVSKVLENNFRENLRMSGLMLFFKSVFIKVLIRLDLSVNLSGFK